MGGYYYDGMGYDTVQPAGVGGAAALTYAQTVLADSPVEYLKLDEASGVTATDSSTNALDGTYRNTPTLGTTAGPLTAGGFAATFTAASNQDVLRAHNAALNLGDVFTIEAFIKRASQARIDNIWTKRDNTPALYVDTDDRLLFNKQGVSVICKSVATIGNNTWTHVAVTKNAATVNVYINGVDSTGAVTNATCADNALNVFVADDALGNFCTASLSQVAIYATALSAARIAAHYAAR